MSEPNLGDELPQALDTGKDVDGIPYCRKHHCRMKLTSGGRKNGPTAYYKCPVPRCNETAQKIKTSREGVVPRQPLACPRCSQDKQVYCEKDDTASTAASVVLKCPSCGWKSSAFVKPHLAAAQLDRGRRTPTVGVGDR